MSSGGDEGYIAFLDADDFWLSNVLTLELISDEHSDLVAFSSLKCNQDASRYSIISRYISEKCAGGESVIWRFQASFCDKFYSAKLINSWGIRFDTSLKYNEDKIFQMECAYLSDNVRFVADYLHVYRKNRGSAMHKAIAPIDYYIPIVDGWIALDVFLNQFETTIGHEVKTGRILASIYLMDMVSTHFKQWRNCKYVLSVLRDHPYYYLFEKMRPQDVSKRNYNNHNLLVRYPRLFECKFRMIGLVEKIGRILISLPFLNKVYEKKKFPFTQVPENEA